MTSYLRVSEKYFPITVTNLKKEVLKKSDFYGNYF